MASTNKLVNNDDLILITGARGFIGSRVVRVLLDRGFTNLRCLVRPAGYLEAMEENARINPVAKIDIIKGNLQSQETCKSIVEGVSVIYHLAAARGEKSYPDAYSNSVITTRNLLDAAMQAKTLKRFVNVSSFAVYSNSEIPSGGLLDEACPLKDQPQRAGEAYTYAKVRQDELVMDYGRKFGIPYVIVRPGVVYGPGNVGITGRVGIGTFGIFLHLGGSNKIPLTYVDNCAEAIMLAGITKDINGEVFNIVDDDLPSSRKLLKMYKDNVGYFKSIYVPRLASFCLCYLWERYCDWSENQLPPSFNRMRWESNWKGNTYSNQKIKKILGWKPRVRFAEAIVHYFKYQRERGRQK